MVTVFPARPEREVLLANSADLGVIQEWNAQKLENYFDLPIPGRQSGFFPLIYLYSIIILGLGVFQ